MCFEQNITQSPSVPTKSEQTRISNPSVSLKTWSCPLLLPYRYTYLHKTFGSRYKSHSKTFFCIVTFSGNGTTSLKSNRLHTQAPNTGWFFLACTCAWTDQGFLFFFIFFNCDQINPPYPPPPPPHTPTPKKNLCLVSVLKHRMPVTCKFCTGPVEQFSRPKLYSLYCHSKSNNQKRADLLLRQSEYPLQKEAEHWKCNKRIPICTFNKWNSACTNTSGQYHYGIIR